MQGVRRYVFQKTKNGIRERLVVHGYVPGTREYKNAYAKEWNLLFPEDRKSIREKWIEINREEKNRRLREKRQAAKKLETGVTCSSAT